MGGRGGVGKWEAGQTSFLAVKAGHWKVTLEMEKTSAFDGTEGALRGKAAWLDCAGWGMPDGEIGSLFHRQQGLWWVFRNRVHQGEDHRESFMSVLLMRVTELKESDSFLRTPCPVPVGNPRPFSLRSIMKGMGCKQKF